MTFQKFPMSLHLGALLGALALTSSLAATGCGEDSGTDGAGGGEAGDDDDDGGDEPVSILDGEPTGHIYAFMYEVYDAEGSNSYLSLVTSLDRTEPDITKAREFAGGRAFLQEYGGKLYIGEPVTPTVTRYSVSASGELVPEGNISFLNYGFDGGQFDDWNVEFIDDHKAYLVNFVDGTTVIWDPTNLEITGEIPGANEFIRDGWSLEGTPAAVRDGKLYRTFSWANYDEGTYSEDLLLAVYDTETDELVELVPETRCPNPGNLVSTDEDGNIYFSNWIWPVGHSILHDAPAPCVLRINAGEDHFDPDWTLDYSEIADGRQGGMFTYQGNGQALFAAFYDENTSFDENTSTWEYVGSNNWRVWKLDLEANTGAPLEGLDFNGGAFTAVRFDDQLHLLVPGGAEVDYATQVYAIGDDGATAQIQLPGWSYQAVQVK